MPELHCAMQFIACITTEAVTTGAVDEIELSNTVTSVVLHRVCDPELPGKNQQKPTIAPTARPNTPGTSTVPVTPIAGEKALSLLF